MVPLAVLLLLPFLKILATSLTLGSGGSGGVFAPGLTIGAAIGGALGMILHLLAPSYVPIETVPVFVIVGMISLFGAVANAPIAVLIMVVEMVGSITILVPAMAAVAVSNLLTAEKTSSGHRFRQKRSPMPIAGNMTGKHSNVSWSGTQ